MSRRLISFLLVMLSFYSSNAQLNPDSNSTQISDPSALPAKLYAQLANAIKPSSFLSASLKDGQALVANAGNTTDPAGIASNLVSLAGYIKPDLFKSSFNATAFKSGAASVKTTGQAATLLKNFESGLKPNALSDIWKMQKGAWSSDLAKLK